MEDRRNIKFLGDRRNINSLGDKRNIKLPKSRRNIIKEVWYTLSFCVLFIPYLLIDLSRIITEEPEYERRCRMQNDRQ